jgi:2C-methyl-D-erythritol 2,4-cyclodiphosphate synthase
MGESFASAQQCGVDLGEFLQSLPQALVSLDAFSALLLLGVGFEQEFKHAARDQTDGQIVKRAVLAALSAGAVGLAAGGETLDQGGPQQLGRNAQWTQKGRFALA